MSQKFQDEHNLDKPKKKAGSKLAIFLVIALVIGIGIAIVILWTSVALSPKITEAKKRADKAMFNAIKFQIQAELKLYKLDRMDSDRPYPPKLDDNPDGPCQTCFSVIKKNPINDTKWTKTGFTYSFGDQSFTYDPESGKLFIP